MLLLYSAAGTLLLLLYSTASTLLILFVWCAHILLKYTMTVVGPGAMPLLGCVLMCVCMMCVCVCMTVVRPAVMPLLRAPCHRCCLHPRRCRPTSLPTLLTFYVPLLTQLQASFLTFIKGCFTYVYEVIPVAAGLFLFDLQQSYLY